MPIPIYQVDAFAEGPFAGNPAAVCLMDRPAPDSWLQRLAAENNLSETAYLWPERGKEFVLRWFTPVSEVSLCGHATLASAHVLWESGLLAPAEEAVFLTRSGELTAVRQGAGIQLDFPTDTALEIFDDGIRSELLSALGLDSALRLARNQHDYLVEVASAEIVRAVQPDFRALARVTMRGVMVTALSDDPRHDFVSRFFAPGEGIDEDPVTGSAHCALGPWWGSRLGKRSLRGYQASARGGVVRVSLDGDRVLLGGAAVTIFRGELAPAAEPPAGE
jgi:PhzF family phenazine biosynthesis protein